MAEDTPRLSKEEAKVIKRRLELAQRFSEKEFVPQSERGWRLFKGLHYEDMDRPSDTPRVIENYAGAFAREKVSAIGFNFPDFVVKPQTRSSQPFAGLMRTALDYEWREAHVMAELRHCLLDREVGGFGVAYCGWLFRTEEIEVTDGRLPVEGEENQAASGSMDADAEPVPAAKVIEDRLYVRRLDPKLFLVDPEAGPSLEQAAYCGFLELRPLKDVKADPRFKNTRQLKGTAENLKAYFGKELMDLDEQDAVPTDQRRVALRHYYEKRRQLHVVMTDEHDLPLLVEKWPWQHAHYPFVILHSIELPDQFYDQSPLLQIEHAQKELNAARTFLANYLRVAHPKLVANGTALTPAQRKQLKSTVPNAIVELEGGQEVEALPIPRIQAEVYSSIEGAQQSIQALYAISQYETAAPPSKRLTTTEVNMIAGQGGARVQQDRDLFEKFVSRVAELSIALLQQYSQKSRSLPIYDRDQNTVVDFADFSMRDIQGQFAVSVTVNSTSAPNETDDAQKIGFLLQSLGPILQLLPVAAQAGLDLKPLIVAVVKSVPGINDTAQILAGVTPGLLSGPPGPPGLPPGPPGLPPGPGGPPMLPPGGFLPPAVPLGPPPLPGPPPPQAPLLTPEILALLLHLHQHGQH